MHKDWIKDPKYRREYEALEEEFSLAAALIEARTRAGLTQEQVAQRLKSTQAVVARLEGRGCKFSTRTLERYAEATGSRLRITFRPAAELLRADARRIRSHAAAVCPDGQTRSRLPDDEFGDAGRGPLRPQVCLGLLTMTAGAEPAARIRLRELEESDVPAVHRLLSDMVVIRYMQVAANYAVTDFIPPVGPITLKYEGKRRTLDRLPIHESVVL